MPRARSPDRDKAFALWRDSSGEIALKEIASQLGVSASQVRNWKAKDEWDKVAQPNVNDCATNNKVGAPKGNKNAVGNIGGAAPLGNSNAVTHGFFRKYFPDGVQELLSEVAALSELDKLWMSIQTQFTAIIHAQKVMFVRDRDDETKVLKRVKESDMSSDHEWEYQHAWDKQANFLQAQSRAIKTLEGLISRYEELLPTSPHAEQHRLRIEKLKVDIEKAKQTDGGGSGDVVVRRWSRGDDGT